MKTGFPISLLAVLLAAGACRTPEAAAPVAARPNILLIVADDLGYSDLGAYGGEIATPVLDWLARSGMIGTDFYVSPRGAPTRAMLLTGVDNHIAGFGAARREIAWNQEGRPGEEGRLSQRVVTVASLLRDAGYLTVMAGKWELGGSPKNRPAARGFERSFALIDGAASHWGDMKSAMPGNELAVYTRNGEPVTQLPPDYYSTEYFTDALIESISATSGDDRPFFAYLAYQAPHGPFAVPRDWRERTAGRYGEGFDAIRKARLLRMKSVSIIDEAVQPYPGIPTVPRWDDLDEEAQHQQAIKMELYAAMVENMDFHIGRVLDHLRRIGKYEDTLVVFLSDNGAEPGDRGPSGMDGRDREWYAAHFPVTDVERWGSEGSFVEYGPAWAQVSTTPFRLFKGTQAEGGIRSPLILSGYGVRKDRTFHLKKFGRVGRMNHAMLHVTDLAPTFLELAGVAHPVAYRGRNVAPLQGVSLVPIMSNGWGELETPHEWIGFAYGQNRAIRRGPWKLVWMPPPFGIAKWRLYRLDRDPAELYNLAEAEPEESASLKALWMDYARANGVALPDPDPEPDQKSKASEM